MQVLLYNELDPATIPGFAKWQALMAADDLKSADIKKIGDNLYRARLNRSDRLLLAFYHQAGQRYALVLEYLPQHDYAHSRFLRHVVRIDEDKIPALTNLPAELPTLTYLNPRQPHFNLLDKILCFDDDQQAIYYLAPPLILIGSAGSGKTALLLEKLKTIHGNILYVTQSSYLVKHSRNLYYAHHYANTQQQVDFLSFEEFLASIHLPIGRAVCWQDFLHWFQNQPRPIIKDAHKLFEEFSGVIAGSSITNAWLSEQEYLALGIKQSIFLPTERASVYELFTRYLVFLKTQQLYDLNIVSHNYLTRVQPRYDFLVVDEVQDFTTIQLFLLLKVLHKPYAFLLCGDSNQIVHPNFFAWKRIKSLFYQQGILPPATELIRILHTNYRNSAALVALANRLLLIKNRRFGSIDRESSYLIQSHGQQQGEVIFLRDSIAIRQELNNKTHSSTRFAVLVLHTSQKAEAQRYFKTPLVFSIQEAKGLEYDNIILYNFLSIEAKRFQEISHNLTPNDLQHELHYARANDKQDKSLEVYKFYINALYVALTRAIQTLYWLEQNPPENFLTLMGLQQTNDLQLKGQQSDLQAWQQEAIRLDLQGKQEQAERIRREILQQQAPDWPVYTPDQYDNLYQQALQQGDKTARLALFEYALVYEDRPLLQALDQNRFKPAYYPEKGLKLLQQKYYLPYQAKNGLALRSQIKRYGVDFRNPFNQTPLMLAAQFGNVEIVQYLIELGAERNHTDNRGLTAFQIALARASQDKKYAQTCLTDLYIALEPDYLLIQLDGSLVKLDNRTPEFFLLNLLIALFYRILPNKLVDRNAFEEQDILTAIKHFPTQLVPDIYKQTGYIADLMAKNALNDQPEPHRLRLFYQLKPGHYLFNPTLTLRIENQWINIYDILKLDSLYYISNPPLGWWYIDNGFHSELFFDPLLAEGRNHIQEQLQQVRLNMLNEALSRLQVLCDQELQKIHPTADTSTTLNLPSEPSA